MNAVNLIETYKVEMILAMTAREKWSSASNGLSSTDTMIPKWFIITLGVVLVATIAFSIIAFYKHRAQNK